MKTLHPIRSHRQVFIVVTGLASFILIAVFLHHLPEGAIRNPQGVLQESGQVIARLFDGSKFPGSAASRANGINVPAEESLASEGEAEFFKNIDNFFSKESVSLDEKNRRMEVASFNALGRKGMVSILRRLDKIERNDREAVENISLVDYTNYRLRWDIPLRQEVAELIARDIPESTELRSRASIIAERAELVRGLGNSDKDLAVNAVKMIDDRRLRAYAMESLLESFMDDGLDYAAAIEQMKREFPDYSRQEISHGKS